MNVDQYLVVATSLMQPTHAYTRMVSADVVHDTFTPRNVQFDIGPLRYGLEMVLDPFSGRV